MGSSLKSARFLVESRLMDAVRGDANAAYDLGMVFSSGAEGMSVDLIEAHKWFNIAAMTGRRDAQQCRADIAEDMTAREIAEAQKAARAWLSTTQARAA
ncbi:SEL1-like repeat protein [Sphingomonas baiyangensis]|uniref:Sel1 repeat family protein n=1 Tax=Sphingomonas baiyangensis TaxID=2572576 RepID=A0A4U1L0Y5_9SPHN|nr:hypothetical protein [Sphingomonas baiyangensis]TKD50441.1 hypothetical protein FBR43_06445 [Sphingomonas baiyangensis]